MAEIPICVVDCETTGLSAAKGDRMVELSIIRYEGGTVTHRFSSLLNPQRDIPYFATEVHGISYWEVLGAPLFCDVADQVGTLLDGCVIVAHNAEFDLDFLNAELVRVGRKPWHGYAICTLQMARKLYGRKNNKLADVAKFLEVPVDGEHRAGADTETTLAIYQRMIDAVQQRDAGRVLTLGAIKGVLVTAQVVQG